MDQNNTSGQLQHSPEHHARYWLSSEYVLYGTSTKQQLCYIHSVTNWSFQELPFSVGPCNLALGIILCLCTILLSIQPWSTQAVQSSMCHINSIQCIPTGLCGIRGITINIFTWLLLCTAKCKESKSPRQGPLRNCHIINDPLR